MSRASAYRLRAREDAGSFAHAWDAVFLPPGEGRIPKRQVDWRKVTLGMLTAQIDSGYVQPLIWRGRMIAVRQKPDNSALFRVIRRGDAVDLHMRAKGARR